MKGNFILSSLQFVGAGVEPLEKSMDSSEKSRSNSPHVTAVFGDGRTSLQFRRTPVG
jgi:hypothetical protein